MLKFRSVKLQNDSDEIKESHIHITAYDDTLHHVSGHFLLEEEPQVVEWARRIHDSLISYVESNKALQDSYCIDSDDIILVKRHNKEDKYSRLCEIIKECPFTILLDNSFTIDKSLDLEDEYGFDLIQPPVVETHPEVSDYCKNYDGYYTGQTI